MQIVEMFGDYHAYRLWTLSLAPSAVQHQSVELSCFIKVVDNVNDTPVSHYIKSSVQYTQQVCQSFHLYCPCLPSTNTCTLQLVNGLYRVFLFLMTTQSALQYRLLPFTHSQTHSYGASMGSTFSFQHNSKWDSYNFLLYTDITCPMCLLAVLYPVIV